MLELDKQHRENFTKSVATYYEQVRVCPVCYKVYMVLDWAREILENEQTSNNNDNKNSQLPRSKRSQRDNNNNNNNSLNDKSKLTIPDLNYNFLFSNSKSIFPNNFIT